MTRLSPRLKTNIPVLVEFNENSVEAVITDISGDGAFLKGEIGKGDGALDGKDVLLKYSIPGDSPLEHCARIIRRRGNGIGIDFTNFDITSQARLWKYILSNLDPEETQLCPYCGEFYKNMPTVCGACGWKLTFSNPGYLEYHEKNSLVKKLSHSVDSLEADQVRRVINFLNGEVLKSEDKETFNEFVASSDVMLKVFSDIRKVAPTDVPVLILGESGTGKELTALTLHERSKRKNNAFITVNCAAIPEALLESELFGYEKGAFTGAYTSKKGKFEIADGGTLFLDEIGEMPLSLQSKLLRIIEDKIVERVGGLKGRKVDIRLIVATNRNLSEEVIMGRFRADLYYRLDVFGINLPSVKERGEDSVLLANYFLKRFSADSGAPKRFSKDTLNAIRHYAWPGNVREIINKTRKALILASGSTVRPGDMDLEVIDIPSPKESSLAEVRESTEKEFIQSTLVRCGYNISRVAREIGISRPSVYALLKKYSISLPGIRKQVS